MKRTDKKIRQIIAQSCQIAGLSNQQQTKLEPIHSVLTSLDNKTKQQIYKETVNYMAENVQLKQYQIQPLMTYLYQRYFQHFQLLQQCRKMEIQTENKSKIQKLEKNQENFIFMYIQKPFITPPLQQAVEITTKRGVNLDPLYLQ